MNNIFEQLRQYIPRRLQPSLRIKLLFLGLILLLIPWIGYQYVNAMEAYLRKSQADALLAMSQAVSTMLNGRIDLFQKQTGILQTVKNTNHVYVRPLKSFILLDGSSDDWERYQNRFQFYGKQHLLESHSPYEKTDLSFTHSLGSWQNFLYILFKVNDDKVVYRSPNSLRIDKNDHLQIAMQTPHGDFVRFVVASSAPGWVNAYKMPLGSPNNLPIKPEIRIKGEWQETSYGYNLEIRIPLSMVGNKIAFAIADVDNKRTRKLKNVIGTSGTRKVDELGTLMVPSPEMEKLLKGLERKSSTQQPDYSATRTWVIDKNRRVIARAGTLKPPVNQLDLAHASFLSRLSQLFYSLILKQPSSEFQDELSSASKLQGNEIDLALTGIAGTNRRKTPDNQVDILSAVFPVWNGSDVIGAVVMEQTSNSILLLQNKAMENLFNISFLAFLFAFSALLIFATRLSSRVIKLRDDAENAISPDGQVKKPINISKVGDEVGDLSRSFADMLQRLGHYNRYLETMASKLSHELRTPLAVVKSSLDNLEMQDLNKKALTYTKRARDGVDRLNNILTRMSEASRLEQSLINMECEDFNLATVISGCVEGYKIAYSSKQIELSLANIEYPCNGAPDLIAQMLDKLVSNAIDFSKNATPIKIQLKQNANEIVLSVSNQGPSLPSEMQSNLFDSMVSVRHKKGEDLHLGLGLYIVRLIVDFHHGKVSAKNTEPATGVEFTVVLPKAK